MQVIQGHVSDAAQVRAQLDRWVEEVAALTIGEPVFFDLRDPWLHAPS